MGRKIEKVAVLGSGVMGSAIAAHLANAGIPSLLLDIVPPALTPEEEGRGLDMTSAEVRDRFAREALARCLKSRPAPFYDKRLAELIEVGNFEDHLERLNEADWIIEVVKEDLAIKKLVLANAAQHRKPGSIISSNTSGISIRGMAAEQDDEFRRHFLGTHFFNPPRYLKLLELIPTDETDPELVTFLDNFVDRRLGKGVVTATDTPNFVANRIGVFGLLDGIRAMEEQGLTVEEIDFLTGPLVGRPRSASFRTADLVGLDTFLAVAGNVYDNCEQDEARDMFLPPELLTKMVDAKLLGEKSGGGFYRKVRGDDGKSQIMTLDIATLEYREKARPKFPEVEPLKSIDELPQRVAALAFGKGRAADFTWRTLSHLFNYCASRVGEICETPRPIDDGMKWGFGWEVGPFELWDAMGVQRTVDRMKRDNLAVPEWVETMLAGGADSFYKFEEARLGIWHPERGEYEIPPLDPGKLQLQHLKRAGNQVKSNAGASLVDLGDGVLCLEFHSKMNAIGGDIIGMVGKALKEVDENWEGLVVGNEGTNFSVGANLMFVLFEAMEGNWEDLNIMIAAFQRATMALKYASKPVVVAPWGMALGGGAEFVLHGQRVRAGAESYIGLVEVGVGAIPAAGGTKEMYLRMLERYSDTDNLLPAVRTAFETIGMAKVATSAVEAKNLGFIREGEGITMNRDRLISDAKETVLGMARAGHKPGRPLTRIPVMGRSGLAALEAALFNMEEGRFISAHDRKIARKLAGVLCGGDLTGTQQVSEQYLLDMEREAFLSLLGERKTLERIQHMLKKGKPLRN